MAWVRQGVQVSYGPQKLTNFLIIVVSTQIRFFLKTNKYANDMNSIDFGRFTPTGKSIDEFALALLSFYCCIKIIGNQILSTNDAKKLLRAVSKATSSNLSFKVINENVVDRMHRGQIKEVTGIFGDVIVTANENSTVATIIDAFTTVEFNRRKIV